ncbi:C-factor [Paramyrothecium foliicola]|nr:C-factor [Paramyrothecium foliicola]
MATYFITGVRSGIGLEYVRQLSTDASNTVIGTVRSLSDHENLKGLHSLVQSSTTKATVHLVEVDISSTESISSLSARLPVNLEGSINTVIFNAAILKSHRQEETSLNVTVKSMLDHFTTNAIGPALLLQSLLPFLAPNAKIANITSGVASLAMLSDGRIPPHITGYSISKAALNMLTVHQAYHLKDRAIVVCVDPGWVKTEMGGPDALIDVADSASGVLKVLKGLTKDDSGRFYFYNGTFEDW